MESEIVNYTINGMSIADYSFGLILIGMLLGVVYDLIESLINYINNQTWLKKIMKK